MALLIERDSHEYRPALGTERWRQFEIDDIGRFDTSFINLCLINNMPDSGLRRTESQFIRLLDSAATDIHVSVKLFSLPGLPRSEQARQHLDEYYCALDSLWNSHFDAVIVTGTEPGSADLRDEPFWAILTDVCEWANENTISCVFSCLAAHAAVLYFDGINRQALTEKRFGVFSETALANHMLTKNCPPHMRFPHSRWNTLDEHELNSCGFRILTRSVEAGVNMFTKSRKSLFVHFQGHPEYDAQTLLKEYRRDIGCYLRRERTEYPEIPIGYFDKNTSELITAFQARATSDRLEISLDLFPDVIVQEMDNWSSTSAAIYRNWLSFVSNKKRSKNGSLQYASARQKATNLKSRAIIGSDPQ
jgi:homoserine O-succinyltransferase